MNRLLIIADDFTGALDTGVQFVKAGLRVKVCLWTEFDASLVDENCSIYLLTVSPAIKRAIRPTGDFVRFVNALLTCDLIIFTKKQTRP